MHSDLLHFCPYRLRFSSLFLSLNPFLMPETSSAVPPSMAKFCFRSIVFIRSLNVFSMSTVTFFPIINPNRIFCYLMHLPCVPWVLLRSQEILVLLEILVLAGWFIPWPFSGLVSCPLKCWCFSNIFFFPFEFVVPWGFSVTGDWWYGSGSRKTIWNPSLFLLLGGLDLGCGVLGQRSPWTFRLNFFSNPYFLSSSDEPFSWRNPRSSTLHCSPGCILSESTGCG